MHSPSLSITRDNCTSGLPSAMSPVEFVVQEDSKVRNHALHFEACLVIVLPIERPGGDSGV